MLSIELHRHSRSVERSSTGSANINRQHLKSSILEYQSNQNLFDGGADAYDFVRERSDEDDEDELNVSSTLIEQVIIPSAAHISSVMTTPKSSELGAILIIDEPANVSPTQQVPCINASPVTFASTPSAIVDGVDHYQEQVYNVVHSSVEANASCSSIEGDTAQSFAQTSLGIPTPKSPESGAMVITDEPEPTMPSANVSATEELLQSSVELLARLEKAMNKASRFIPRPNIKIEPCED